MEDIRNERENMINIRDNEWLSSLHFNSIKIKLLIII